MGLGNTPRHAVPGVIPIDVDPTPATMRLADQSPNPSRIIQRGRPKVYRGEADGGGNGTVELPKVDGRQDMFVERIAVWSPDSALSGQALVYLDEEDDDNWTGDGTDNAKLDTNDCNHAIYVPGGHRIVVAFRGMSPNASLRVMIQPRYEPAVTEVS